MIIIYLSLLGLYKRQISKYYETIGNLCYHDIILFLHSHTAVCSELLGFTCAAGSRAAALVLQGCLYTAPIGNLSAKPRHLLNLLS